MKSPTPLYIILSNLRYHGNFSSNLFPPLLKRKKILRVRTIRLRFVSFFLSFLACSRANSTRVSSRVFLPLRISARFPDRQPRTTRQACTWSMAHGYNPYIVLGLQSEHRGGRINLRLVSSQLLLPFRHFSFSLFFSSHTHAQ